MFSFIKIGGGDKMFIKYVKKKKAYHRKTTALSVLLMMLFIFFIMMPVVNANEILGIDISISPNPIPCGGSATVTATIKRAPLRRELPLGGIVKLWDYDSGFRNGDDLLDQEHGILWSEETRVTFTLRCDIKEGGCDLYGPSGESGESSTDIFVSFYDKKSARIHVKCEQIEVDGEISMSGTDTVIAGDETSATLSADTAIENISSAQWRISYNSSAFEVINVEFINPELVVKETEGFLSYDTTESDVILFNLTETLIPLTLDGILVNINLLAKTDSTTIWDTTNLKCKEDSVFNNELGEKINVCMGGNHSIFIAPNDTTGPVIDDSLVSFTQGKIVGSAGSITDDLDSYENYLTVSLFNESNELVAEEFVNEDGSFQLDSFFWLSNVSTLTAYNGVNLSTSYGFIPTKTSVPYVLPNYQTFSQENKGKPEETVQLDFEVLNRCDSSETYDFMVTNANGWEIADSEFEMVLEPMENKTVTVNVTIPTSAKNQSTNSITLIMTSQTYPENSDSNSAEIIVFGTYEEPSKPTPGEETPGFELILLIIVALVVILLKRRYNHS